jgi:hypothetical protein
MNTVLLFASPIINVLVTGIFAGMITRQYLRRRRVYQLYWSIALLMAFAATIAYVVMILAQPTSSLGILCFRIYYTLGAALMPSWLGLGSIALLGKPMLTRSCLMFLSFLSMIATAFTFDGSIDMQKLSQIAGTPGTGTLHPGPWLVTTILLNTLGVVAIAGVALYSGLKLVRKQSQVGGLQSLNLLWANVLIMAGALIDAAAGTLARVLGLQSTFWIIMALGWIVFFAGVLLTGRRSKKSQTAATSTQSQPETPVAPRTSR